MDQGRWKEGSRTKVKDAGLVVQRLRVSVVELGLTSRSFEHLTPC